MPAINNIFNKHLLEIKKEKNANNRVLLKSVTFNYVKTNFTHKMLSVLIEPEGSRELFW